MILAASLTLLGRKTVANSYKAEDMAKSKLDNIVTTTGINHQSKLEKVTFTKAAAHLLDFALKSSLPFPTHLVACTQTPDRLMPSPSLDIINTRDDLCFTRYVDVRTGCTGFVDSAMLSKAFIAAQEDSVVYCVTGDISSRIVDPNDHATSLVFGDAINLSVFQSDSGSRRPLLYHEFVSCIANKFKDAICLDKEYLIMDGLRVLTFVLQSVVPVLKEYIQRIDEVDDLSSFSLVLHQANKFIVDLINKSIQAEFPDLAVHPFCLEDIGNSSSSTIPVAISRLFACLHCKSRKVIICGFGVGMATHIGVIEIENPLIHFLYEDKIPA